LTDEKESGFSSAAVRRAVLAATVQHPAVVYPAALAVVGGLGAAVLAGTPTAIGAAVVGGGVAAAAWLFNYMFRREAFASRYLESAHNVLVKRREAVLEALGADLKKLGAKDAARQLQRFREKIEAFEEILGQKFGRQELTFGRFLGIAEQVYLAGVDNLLAMVLALKGAAAIDTAYIRKRIDFLVGDPATSPTEENELAGLRRQLELHKAYQGKVDAHLAMNETALAQLDASIAAVADIRTGGSAQVDMETAMAELARVAAQAKEYSTQ
jgi:hypothetical protein